jgi:signal peptidase II
MRYKIIGLILAIFTLIADQYSKRLILLYFANSVSKSLEITSFFNLCLVWNRGVSFGLFNSYNARDILLVIAGFIVLLLISMLYKSKNYYTSVSLGLIIGGAIGNIWDRYKYGAVIDFIEVYYKRLYWPAFNVADSFIVIGLLMLLLEKKMVRNEN